MGKIDQQLTIKKIQYNDCNFTFQHHKSGINGTNDSCYTIFRKCDRKLCVVYFNSEEAYNWKKASLSEEAYNWKKASLRLLNNEAEILNE